MTEPAAGEGGTKGSRRNPGIAGKESYRPHQKTVTEKRSPYPIRSSGVKCLEEGDSEAEFEGTREAYAGMARQEEAGDSTSALIKFLMEKDAQDRRDRAEELAVQREMLEQEKKRHQLAEEQIRASREAEELRWRETEESRRTYDNDRRQRERREDGRVRELRELLNERLKGLGMYKEGSELGAYLSKFERIMRMGEVREDSWGDRLYPKLTETLCKRITKDLDSNKSYDVLKKNLLRAVGETAITYGNSLLGATSELFKGMTAGSMADWLSRTTMGMFRDCESVEDCTVAAALAVLRRILPESGKMFMDGKKIKNWGDLRENLEDWMSGRQPGNYFKSIGSLSENSSRGYRASGNVYGQGDKSRGNVVGGVVSSNVGARSNYGGSYSNSGGYTVKCFSCGELGHRSFECKKGKSVSASEVRVPVCYTCGKSGHKSPECTQKGKGTSAIKNEPPTKLSVLRRAGSGAQGNVVTGLVCGVKSEILIDSGAEMASIPRTLVPEGVRWLSDVVVRSYGGTERMCRSFMGEFSIGGYKKCVRTVVDESDEEGVACLVPISLENDEEAKAYRGAIKAHKELQKVNMNVLTRSMHVKELESERCESGGVDSAIEWDVVEPVGVCMEVVHELEDLTSSHPDPSIMPEVLSRVGEGHGADEAEGLPEAEQPQAKVSEGIARGKAVPLDKLSDESVHDDLSGLVEEIGPVKAGSDTEMLIKEVKEDDSLAVWRELADRKERGFKWSKGILVKEMYVNWEEYREVIVLPRSLRSKVLSIGHDRNGHLGAEKVSQLVKKYFIWPSMAKEIFEYCASCSSCQLRSKSKPRRAPVVDRPVMSEPFETVAIDLVGPLPKGKGGCRFILTYICLATRWPEAIPLRSITAKAVVEGLWSIFSRTSIPEVLLSDQGSQFCGKVMSQLCAWLGVEKVKTSPYHPETNGCVERMHGTLKSILGKCMEKGGDWVEQINFALFVLREMPHKDSGFSPFDLVYGFRVRTPLDALYHGLFECESKKLGVCEWVMRMAERLEGLRDCAALGLAKGKESRLQYVNRGCKLRTFKEGELVLYRVPGLSCKLSDSWQGPYIIMKRVGEVNYRIGKVGKALQGGAC